MLPTTKLSTPRLPTKPKLVIFTLFLMIPDLACRNQGLEQTSNRDSESSKILLEVDDRLTPQSAQLIDVSAKIEAYINDGIEAIRAQYDHNETKIQNDFMNFASKIADRLTKAQKGSGITLGGISIVPYTEIEAFAISHLDPAKHEILHVKFADSRYKNNPVGLFAGKVVSHKFQELADFTVGPTIKVHNTLIGVDKLSHFLEQGYWYFNSKLSPGERREFGAYMEGDPALASSLWPKYKDIFAGYCHCFAYYGFFGSNASGVISFADMQANESGFAFYQKLQKSPISYHFKFSDYSYSTWNEVDTPSKFANGVTAIP